MNAPYTWLNEYTDLSDISIKQFCDAITLSGSKVERCFCEADSIHGVVTGKVTEMQRHPDSDHLWVCKVDVAAEELLQIVTGAQNLSVGDIVPVALDGSELPGGTKIKAGKLRGEVSQGMMCSLGELGLTTHDFPECIEDGIAVLAADTPLGEDICKVLGLDDTSIEFEITSNRPDCLCVSGLAREAAATFRRDFNFPAPTVSPPRRRRPTPSWPRRRRASSSSSLNAPAWRRPCTISASTRAASPCTCMCRRRS